MLKTDLGNEHCGREDEGRDKYIECESAPQFIIEFARDEKRDASHPDPEDDVAEDH